MRIRKRAGSALLVVTASALAIGLSATMALATTATLTVKVSGSSSTGTVTASSSKTVLTDNGVSVTCTSSKATSVIKNGTHMGTSPVGIGTVTKLSFSGCTGPLGGVTVTVHSLPYKLSIDSKTVSGKTDGIISGVNTFVSTTGCSFTTSGSAPGFYNNGNHTLNMTSKLPITPLNKAQLTISGVSGCAGLIHNGDHPTYTATYTVSPTSLKITSS
jgi:hypothetical protein